MINIPKFNPKNPSYTHLKIDKTSDGYDLKDIHTDIQINYTSQNLIVNFMNYGDYVQENNYLVCNSDMWNQTVVEVFIAPVEKDAVTNKIIQEYVEIEATPKGAIYVSKIINPDGKGQHNQHAFLKCEKDTLFPQIASSLETGIWSAQLTIPFSMIGGRGKSGQLFKANFFRVQMNQKGQGNCTPDTCKYMAWQPTMAYPPKFHLPEFFGDFVLE